MKRLGFNVVVTPDLTDAMYDPRKRPFVSHARGTELVIEHIETNWLSFGRQRRPDARSPGHERSERIASGDNNMGRRQFIRNSTFALSSMSSVEGAGIEYQQSNQRVGPPLSRAVRAVSIGLDKGQPLEQIAISDLLHSAAGPDEDSQAAGSHAATAARPLGRDVYVVQDFHRPGGICIVQAIGVAVQANVRPSRFASLPQGHLLVVRTLS